MVSSPGPPKIRSRPALAQMTSSPPRPRMTSLPPRPTITSGPGVPTRSSPSGVPTIVATRPSQVGCCASAGVAATSTRVEASNARSAIRHPGMVIRRGSCVGMTPLWATAGYRRTVQPCVLGEGFPYPAARRRSWSGIWTLRRPSDRVRRGGSRSSGPVQQLARASSASQICRLPSMPSPPSLVVRTDFGTAARLSKVATLSWSMP